MYFQDGMGQDKTAYVQSLLDRIEELEKELKQQQEKKPVTMKEVRKRK